MLWSYLGRKDFFGKLEYGSLLVAYLTSFLSFLLPKRTPVLLKYLLIFHLAQVCQVNLSPPTAPRVGVIGLAKFIKDVTWWNLIQWHVDIIRRIILESSSLLFWERLQKCRFLFSFWTICVLQTLATELLLPSQDQSEEEASRHMKAEPN